MTIYKQCPFCEELFEIGPEDDEPMKRHIREMHTDDGHATPPLSFEEVRFELGRGGDDDAPRGLLLAVLHKREVFAPVIAEWYGLSESVIQRQFDALEADLLVSSRDEVEDDATLDGDES